MALAAQDGSTVNRHSFHDESVFEQERERIFKKTWQFLAHESEVAKPGDYVTRKLAGDEVIVARGDDGIVRVLLNSCRHRGVKVCPADWGNSKRFMCGYHGWTYANTGALRGVPYDSILYPNMDKKKFGLHEARTDTYQGLIFGTWSPDTPPLRDELGDMAWHLDTVFGRGEFEVYGPPIRSTGLFNWKSGSENWTGDTYHGDVSHKTIMDAGLVFDFEDLLQSVAERGGAPIPNETTEKLAALQFIAGQGHAGVILRLPMDFNVPVFFGHDENVWSEFASNLTPEQLDIASRRIVTVCTVFPNFSFIEGVQQNMGDDLPPTATMSARLWYPVSATETEVYSWLFVPKQASAEWKRRSQISLARAFGLGGMLELDDFTNWSSTAQANRGPVGMSLDNDYAALPEQPVEGTTIPGRVFAGSPHHDVNFRAFFSEWRRRIEAEA